MVWSTFSLHQHWIGDHFLEIGVKLEKEGYPVDEWQSETSLAEKDLGMKWRTGRETVCDVTIQQMALALKEQSVDA